MRWGLWLGISVLLGSCGCVTTAEKNAMRLARETLTQVVEYEDVVREWSRETRAIYEKAYTELERHVQDQRDLEYRHWVNKLAGDLADRAIEKPIRDTEFRAFIMTVLNEEQVAMAELSAINEKLQTERQHTVEALKKQEQRLKKTRAKLEKLQQEPGFQERVSQLKQIYAVIKKAHDEAKERKKVEEAQAKADANGTDSTQSSSGATAPSVSGETTE